jgi:hypothetical protein
MTVFIAVLTPRICRFDLFRRGGKGNVTKPGSFPIADYSLKKATRAAIRRVDCAAYAGRAPLFGKILLCFGPRRGVYRR